MTCSGFDENILNSFKVSLIYFPIMEVRNDEKKNKWIYILYIFLHRIVVIQRLCIAGYICDTTFDIAGAYGER